MFHKNISVLLSTFIGAATISLVTISAATNADSADATAPSCPAFLNQEFKKLHSSDSVNLCSLYKGKPMVLVNTASHCGYTRQFKGLEALYQKYKADGVELVGFASDDFKQEAGSELEAATICYKNYGVTFTMLSPTHVRGSDANPVFSHLNSETSKPSWNFNKYLITSAGKVEHFGSNVEPTESKLEAALKQAL